MRSKPLLFTAMLLFLSCYNLKAQIKIGTNPTTIDASSNLEVEASEPGRKFKIDKVTGKVTIADGTQEDNEVLISDANGLTKWSKINVENLYTLPRMSMIGAQTGALADGVRVNLTYPNIASLENGWYDHGDGVHSSYGGFYLAETELKMENSEGCTGTSVMGLEINLILNGAVAPFAVLDERLTPVYQDTYITKVTQVIGILGGTKVSFSILPTIKSPQAGCVTKVLSGSMRMVYLP